MRHVLIETSFGSDSWLRASSALTSSGVVSVMSLSRSNSTVPSETVVKSKSPSIMR